MTEEQFCEAHNQFFGEPVSSLKQMAHISFTGEELFEFCNHIIVRNGTTPPDFEPIIRKNVYRNLVFLYQKDMQSIPCKDRTEVENKIVSGIIADIKK
jgi:hypothetical protein